MLSIAALIAGAGGNYVLKRRYRLLTLSEADVNEILTRIVERFHDVKSSVTPSGPETAEVTL